MSRPQFRPWHEMMHDIFDENWPGHVGGGVYVRHGNGKRTRIIVPGYRPPPIRRYDNEENDGMLPQQRDIMEACSQFFEDTGNDPISADEAAKRAGYENTSRFREWMAGLVRIGKLKRVSGGNGYLPNVS